MTTSFEAFGGLDGGYAASYPGSRAIGIPFSRAVRSDGIGRHCSSRRCPGREEGRSGHGRRAASTRAAPPASRSFPSCASGTHPSGAYPSCPSELLSARPAFGLAIRGLYRIVSVDRTVVNVDRGERRTLLVVLQILVGILLVLVFLLTHLLSHHLGSIRDVQRVLARLELLPCSHHSVRELPEFRVCADQARDIL